VRDTELQEALAAHLDETRLHVTRVEDAFAQAGAEPSAARSAALAGLKAHHEGQEAREPTLTDALEATAAIRIEHLELGLYDPVLELARALGHEACAELLAANRNDEERLLDRVARIAERLCAELPG
jgi:ferritin-like metal-binding protein YciE